MNCTKPHFDYEFWELQLKAAYKEGALDKFIEEVNWETSETKQVLEILKRRYDDQDDNS